MDVQQQLTRVPVSIYIQIDRKKICSLEASLSQTVAEFRALLVRKQVKLSANAHFIDASGYRVLVSDEENKLIDDLVIEDGPSTIIHLETENYSDIGDASCSSPTRKLSIFILILITILCASRFLIVNDYVEKRIKQQLCPWFHDSEFSALLRILSCSNDQSTAGHMENKIENTSSADVTSDNEGNHIETLEFVKNFHVSNWEMYNDLISNREQYKADYEWFHNTESNTGTCRSSFDERVIYSYETIKDTAESIRQFTDKEFQTWPQHVKNKVDIEKKFEGAIDTENDEFSLDVDGKITLNLYLLAWRRDEKGNVLIETYKTIFERTAGVKCRFNPEFWSGERDRILNAKKYFVLTAIETNPVYRNFLSGDRHK